MKGLRYKIGSGYFILLLVVLSLGIYSAYNFIRLERSIGKLLLENSPSVSAATNMLNTLIDQEGLQVRMISESDSLHLFEYQRNRDKFLHWFEQAELSAFMPAEHVVLDSIISNYRNYLALSDSVFNLIKTDKTTFSKFYIENILPIDEKVRSGCLELLVLNQNRIIETNKKVREIAGKGTLLALFSLIFFGVIMVIGFYMSLTRSLIEPTKKITQTIRQVDKGSFMQKLDIQSDDEISELVAEFNKMTERLSHFEKMNIHEIIAEKKKAEALINSLSEPIFVTDDQKRLILINRAAEQLLEMDQSQWLNQPIPKVIKNPKLSDFLMSSLTAEKEFYSSDQLIEVNKKEKIFFYKPRQTMITNEDGSSQGMVSVFEDVTRFQELNQLKSDFVATISHEFQTPLTTINMTIDILSKQIAGEINSRQQELLQAAKNDTGRLIKMVKDLLNLSRLESGQFPMEKSKINISELIENTLRPLLILFQEKQIALEINQPPAPVFVWIDPRQISWVLNNLIENAIRCTKPTGKISISIEHLINELQIKIADTGIGIHQDALKIIFEKFYQLKDTSDSRAGSVGLGLAIAKKVIEDHGGRIWATSEVGVGSIFTFTLPLLGIFE